MCSATFKQVFLIPNIRTARCIVKGIHIVFVLKQIVVEMPHTIERWLKTGDSHLIEFIEVCNELISVGTYFKPKSFKRGFA